MVVLFHVREYDCSGVFGSHQKLGLRVFVLAVQLRVDELECDVRLFLEPLCFHACRLTRDHVLFFLILQLLVLPKAFQEIPGLCSLLFNVDVVCFAESLVVEPLD